jgi:flagellar biosynthesis protein FliQ
MGINKVVGMCISNSCHNMLSLFPITTAITSNTITSIDKILLGLFMLLLLTSWDVAHLIALVTILNFF